MNKKVLFYLIMTALCFGTLEISGKIAGNNLDPYQFTFPNRADDNSADCNRRAEGTEKSGDGGGC